MHIWVGGTCTRTSYVANIHNRLHTVFLLLWTLYIKQLQWYVT